MSLPRCPRCDQYLGQDGAAGFDLSQARKLASLPETPLPSRDALKSLLQAFDVLVRSLWLA
jgi:hypothetical protein